MNGSKKKSKWRRKKEEKEDTEKVNEWEQKEK